MMHSQGLQLLGRTMIAGGGASSWASALRQVDAHALQRGGKSGSRSDCLLAAAQQQEQRQGVAHHAKLACMLAHVTPTGSAPSPQASTLVVVEIKGGSVEAPTLNTLSAAKALGHEITALVAGPPGEAQTAATAAAGLSGVSKASTSACTHEPTRHMCMHARRRERGGGATELHLPSCLLQVLVAQHPSLKHQLAEPMAALLQAVQGK
jgi:hypothetical protein